MNDDFLPIDSVEIKIEGILSSLERRLNQLIYEHGIREDMIKAVALGPNEFNSLKVEMSEKFRLRDPDMDLRLKCATEMKFHNMPVLCMGRHGIEFLVDEAWYIQIKEVRKHLVLEGLDS